MTKAYIQVYKEKMLGAVELRDHTLLASWHDRHRSVERLAAPKLATKG